MSNAETTAIDAKEMSTRMTHAPVVERPAIHDGTGRAVMDRAFKFGEYTNPLSNSKRV
jgi:hypothetical protein